MLVSVLASGSEGNSTYVETDDVKLLIDIGMTTKYIKERLLEIGTNPEEIDYIFMTHTHKDHTGALKTFINKYKTKVVLTESMYNDLDVLHEYDNVIITSDAFKIGDTLVDNFKTSHDANDARGYIISDSVSSMVYMTDTGYLNQKYFKKLYNKNMYVMEANHDVEMLLNGRYPKWLKTRILSDKGHLSNNAAGFYLSKLIGPDTKKVILAHLSHENNTPEVALKTVSDTLAEYDINFNDISIAMQREKSEDIRI